MIPCLPQPMNRLQYNKCITTRTGDIIFFHTGVSPAAILDLNVNNVLSCTLDDGIILLYH